MVSGLTEPEEGSAAESHADSHGNRSNICATRHRKGPVLQVARRPHLLHSRDVFRRCVKPNDSKNDIPHAAMDCRAPQTPDE